MGVSTVFIDNLPNEIRKIWVYNLFARYGKIREIFIPFKKSKISGQSFGFVRFNNDRDANIAIASSNNTWCWGHRLVVKKARFLMEKDNHASYNQNLGGYSIGRVSNGQSNHFKSGIKNPQFLNNNETENFLHASNVVLNGANTGQKAREENRGKEIWRRKGVPESSKQGVERNLLVLQPSGNGWLCRSAFGRIKRLVSAQKLLDVFSKEGVEKCQIKPAGGRFMLVVFPNENMRDKVINDKWIANWFEELKPWDEDPAQIERYVWLECYGLPLNAWNVQSFRAIANKWGQFLEVDNDTLTGNSFEKGKVLIVTENAKKIEDQIQLVVNGKEYMVRVEEVDSFRVIEPDRSISMESSMEKDDEMDKTSDDKEDRVGGLNQSKSKDDRAVIENENDKVADNVDEMENNCEREKHLETLNCDDMEIHKPSVREPNLDKVFTVSNPQIGDIRNQVVKGKKIDPSAVIQLETIMEDEEESFVGESPDLRTNDCVEDFAIFENSSHKEFPEEYWKSANEQIERVPNIQPSEPKVLTARQKRAKLRKEIRDICDSLDEGTQVGDIWEVDSEHSDSIDSEDILRRNNIIMKGFDEAVQVSKRIGIVFHESDEAVINRLAQS